MKSMLQHHENVQQPVHHKAEDGEWRLAQALVVAQLSIKVKMASTFS